MNTCQHIYRKALRRDHDTMDVHTHFIVCHIHMLICIALLKISLKYTLLRIFVNNDDRKSFYYMQMYNFKMLGFMTSTLTSVMRWPKLVSGIRVFTGEVGMFKPETLKHVNCSKFNTYNEINNVRGCEMTYAKHTLRFRT